MIVVGRFEAPPPPSRAADDRPRRSHRPRREPTDPRRRRRGRPLERARDLARLGALGAGGARPRRATRRRRSRSAATAAGRSRAQVTAAVTRRVRRRDAAGARRLEAGRRRSARSTSCCPSCTARSARTAPCRACSSSRACRTSAPASPPPRSAWTRTSSRRCCATAASRSRATSTLRLGDEIENPFGYPVFVKPARLGSSVGISKAHDEAELDAAVALARRHDEKVLVEEFVAGHRGRVRRARQPAPAAVASRRRRDRPARRVVRLRGQVRRGRLGHHRPRPHPGRDVAARVQALAVDSFVATECEGMARVDFFVREDGEVVVNELNTIPGFTSTSVYARLFEASGIPYARAARPPDPARARAPRAALRPRVLGAGRRPR